MKTFSRWLIVPTLVVGFAYLLRAQEPGEERKTGKILLLKTGHAMEGDIEQIGKQICVRRGVSEVWIAADKTMRLSPDWLDAYAFMQTLIRQDSANDRVKLARWCQQNRLTADALEQARLALELQPNHGEAKLMVVQLERALKEPPPKVVVAAPAPPPRKVEPAPLVDVHAETLTAFSIKVQPILINACANCHAGAADKKFRLERVSGTGHKAATLRNLAAVLNHVDLDRPAISPLLVKSITPHGHEDKAPLKDRSAVPFQAVQQWIVETVAKNPQLKLYRDAKKPSKTKSQEKPSTFSTERSATPTAGDEISVSAPRLEVTLLKETPRELDWCDPEHFNRFAHPHGAPWRTVSTAQR